MVEILHITNPDSKMMEEIILVEKSAFQGEGNVDLWILKALIKYGLVFVLKENDRIVSIIEYMQKFNEKKVFLYGLSTLKAFQQRGYANLLMKKTEEYLMKIGIEEIELTVSPDNKIAIDLYKKYSYDVLDYLENEYGKSIDRLLMRKHLK